VVKFSGTGSNLGDLVKASGVAGILLNRVDPLDSSKS